MAGAFNNEILKTLLARRDLTVEQARGLFNQIMDGELGEAHIAAVLVALAAKGETVQEITGAARAMRAHSVKLETGGAAVIDIVGTGGTGLATMNVSSPSAVVAAGAGVRVAKHGNRTNTRPSGSADVLAALGVNIDCGPEIEARCLAEAGVCFCFAVRHHPAMKFAVPVRKQLAVRTVFNVLGPLTNPAGAARQLTGVFSTAMVEPICRVLGALGSERAMVVCGEDGLDEITITAPTHVAEWIGGKCSTRTIRPEDFGIKRARLEDLAVSSPAESAERIRAVLGGKKGPDRDIIILNTAAALAVAGAAADMGAGIPLAERSIDSGAAAGALEKLVAVSNER